MSFGTVVFVGAGCSKNFGYPLTNELLPTALQRTKKPATLFSGIRSPANDLKDQQRFVQGLKRLLPGLQQQWTTSQRCGKPISIAITDVLSLIDHALASGHHFGQRQSTRELAELRQFVERAIFEVLYDDGGYTPSQESMLDRFIARIRAEVNRDNRVAMISTNYDLALEVPLFATYVGKNSEERISSDFDFGMNWRSPFFSNRIYVRPRKPRWALFKLHGSFNWLRCPVCQHVYLNIYGSIAFQAFRDKVDDNNRCDCGYGPLSTHLVAPSLVRDVRDPNLLDIWKHSQEVLRNANKWYIIGYSFPTEDVAIRSMFLRAYHSREQKPEVIVIQRGEEAYDRYRMFFPDCKYLPAGWEQFLNKEV